MRKSTAIDRPPVQEEAAAMDDVRFDRVLATNPRLAVGIMPGHQSPFTIEMLDDLPLDARVFAAVEGVRQGEIEAVQVGGVVGHRDRDQDVEFRAAPRRSGRVDVFYQGITLPAYRGDLRIETEIA